MMNIRMMNEEYNENFGVEINSEVYHQDFDDAGFDIVTEQEKEHINPYEIPNSYDKNGRSCRKNN